MARSLLRRSAAMARDLGSAPGATAPKCVWTGSAMIARSRAFHRLGSRGHGFGRDCADKRRSDAECEKTIQERATRNHFLRILSGGGTQGARRVRLPMRFFSLTPVRIRGRRSQRILI